MRLGSYDILALIGVGGMGEVYRARDLRLKREVAVKELPAEWRHDRDRRARLQREAEVLATLIILELPERELSISRQLIRRHVVRATDGGQPIGPRRIIQDESPGARRETAAGLDGDAHQTADQD
jgi:serine/threonine protein kinase